MQQPKSQLVMKRLRSRQLELPTAQRSTKHHSHHKVERELCRGRVGSQKCGSRNCPDGSKVVLHCAMYDRALAMCIRLL